MWILYTHLAVSAICLFVCLVSKSFMSDAKKEFIKMQPKPNMSRVGAFFKILIVSLIPVINVLSASVTFYYAICPLEDYIKMTEKNKKNVDKDAEVLEQYKKDQAA